MTMPSNSPTILFLCTGNSCRSQMAEGWTRHLWPHRFQAYSAGVETHGLNPLAVQAMAEHGVDISAHQSKLVSDLAHIHFDLVVTVCAHAAQSCPMFAGGSRIIHQQFDDPPRLAQGKSPQESLAIYNTVCEQIRDFIKTLPTLF